MQHVVWKFPMQNKHLTGEVFTLELPIGARLLTVRVQIEMTGRGAIEVPALWALCMDEATKQKRRFRFVMTGDEADGVAAYVGTVEMVNGYIFHLFEVA